MADSPFKRGGCLQGRAVSYHEIFPWVDADGRRQRITFAPGCFNDSIRGDITACVEHDHSTAFANTKDGSMVLFQRPDGLYFRIWNEESAASERAFVAVSAGDLVGVSIGAIHEETTTNATGVVIVMQSRLVELSLCRRPYSGRTTLRHVNETELIDNNHRAPCDPWNE